MTKKKIITIALLALGVALVLAGFIFICQAGTSHTGHSGGVSRASTSIKFGGDFYSTSAQYTGLAANAATDIYKLLSNVAGIFFMFVGAVELCLTLWVTDIKELITFKKKEAPVETVVLNDNAAE